MHHLDILSLSLSSYSLAPSHLASFAPFPLNFFLQLGSALKPWLLNLHPFSLICVFLFLNYIFGVKIVLYNPIYYINISALLRTLRPCCNPTQSAICSLTIFQPSSLPARTSSSCLHLPVFKRHLAFSRAAVWLNFLHPPSVSPYPSSRSSWCLLASAKQTPGCELYFVDNMFWMRWLDRFAPDMFLVILNPMMSDARMCLVGRFKVRK